MTYVIFFETLFEEECIEKVSKIIERNIDKLDFAVLPVPRELIEYSFRGYISSKTSEDVSKIMIRDYRDRLIQIRPLMRIIQPLIEVIYEALRKRPEVRIITTYSIEDLQKGEITAMDIISMLVGWRRNIEKKIEKIRMSVSKTIRELSRKIVQESSILRKEQPKIGVIVPSSCIECIILRTYVERVLGHKRDVVQACTRLPPPSQLTYMYIYAEENEKEIKKMISIYKDFVMNYLLISNNIHEAYRNFIKDKGRNYETFVREALSKFIDTVKRELVELLR
ncbi:MAG: hypothetical protein GXO26_00600 [Crenarchaeota archaeon]|nr:hypothetical protein [Thermoproteota archaeon]